MHIELSNAQVDQVVRAASDSGDIWALLLGLDAAKPTIEEQSRLAGKPLLCHSLLLGLLVLAAFPSDGDDLSITQVAERVGLGKSTAHRYVTTLVAAGLLEREPNTRRHRRAGSRPATATTVSRPGSASTQARMASGAEPVRLELSKAQVNQLVQDASSTTSLSIAFRGIALGLRGLADVDQLGDRRMSRSLLLGLMILAVFPPDGEYVRVADVARRLQLNVSTAHRYMSTLQAVGLLERDPSTRRYRRPAHAFAVSRPRSNRKRPRGR